MIDTPRVAALTARLHEGKTAAQIVGEDWTQEYRAMACTLERELAEMREMLVTVARLSVTAWRDTQPPVSAIRRPFATAGVSAARPSITGQSR